MARGPQCSFHCCDDSAAIISLVAEEPEPEEAEVESASSADVSRQGSTADFASLEDEAVAG